VPAVALVDEHDLQALVQEGHLSQAVRQDLVREHELGEDLAVGLEGDLGAAPLRLADLLELLRLDAALVALVVQRPSRRTSTSRYSESAFTTLTPTPCRPPDTL
jgi:hypothetical protein